MSEELVPLTPEEKAYEAYQLRVKGHDWMTIANALGYPSTTSAVRAVAQFISAARSAISDENKKEVVDLELSRLDSLQSAYFQSALDGDYKAAELVLKFMTHRARLLQLGEEQTSTNRTIIITSDEYAQRLREIAEGEDDR